MLLDILSSKFMVFLYYLCICLFSKLINVILKFIYENGLMNSVFFWDVLYCWIFDLFICEMVINENKCNIYVNWIFFMFLKCFIYGMSLFCYLSYLLVWWEVDFIYVIICKILVVVNDFIIIILFMLCLYICFLGNLILVLFLGFWLI